MIDGSFPYRVENHLISITNEDENYLEQIYKSFQNKKTTDFIKLYLEIIQ